MINEGCPGSKEVKTPYPEELLCVYCGSRNEIWTDEPDMECKNCKKTINRDLKPSCLEWCPSAKECVGLAKYERIMKAIESRQDKGQ